MTKNIISLFFIVCFLEGCASGSGTRPTRATGLITNKFDSQIVLIEPVYYPDKYADPGQTVRLPIFSPPLPTCISLETPEGVKSYMIQNPPSWSHIRSEYFITPVIGTPANPKFRLIISSEGLFYVNESGSKKMEVEPTDSCSE